MTASSAPDRFEDKAVTGRRAGMLSTAFGPAIIAALKDASVMEIMANADGRVWIERHDAGKIHDGVTLTAGARERIIRLVASHTGGECGYDRPIVSAELPGSGERFEGILPPVASAPVFSIRKPATRIFTLDDYVRREIMSGADALVLKSAIAARKNILIAGGTSSGKTTLANALLAEVAVRDERILILEDTRELHCAAADFVALRAAPGVTLADLARSTMRLRPDRIVVGETRGGEALDLLKAWNTGHPGGITTVHANSAEAALFRLEQLIGERTVSAPKQLIAEAVDLVVFIARGKGGRRVEEIIRVDGLDANGAYRTAHAHPLNPSLVNNGAKS